MKKTGLRIKLSGLSRIIFILTTYYLLLTTYCLYAVIATRFADLILENVQIGESYNLRTLKNCPMVITNLGNETVDVMIDVEFPMGDVKPGYEPIPDPSWIQIVPAKYRLGSQEQGSSDIIITIPNDKKLIGKHFQATLLTASQSFPPPTGNFIIATGCVSRIRFSIGGMGPESLKAEKKRKKMMTLDFELIPANIKVKSSVELGKKINLREKKGIGLTLINKSTEPVPLIMKSEVNMMVLGTEKEYEIGDPKFLTIKPKKLKLKGESMKKLTMYLNIPNEEKYKNKKYVFLIKAEVPADVPVEVFSKLYVTTSE
ncbi:MAG: hypothetical protein HY919_03095 [Elusimicrobia bacterium]|nr:hypothetical protein [Elusimicrobiota bacterium]